MAYGVSKAFDDVLSRRDKTTIRGVDSTERIFYISPYWMKEILIRNNGTNDVQIRLSEREKPITIPAGKELDLSGEFAYFFVSAPVKQDIDILYRPSRKLIARNVAPIALGLDGLDDYILVQDNTSLDITSHISNEVLIYLNKINANQMFIQKYYCYNLWIRSTNNIRFADTINHYVDSEVITLFKKWQHIVGKFDGNVGDLLTSDNTKIYVNATSTQVLNTGGQWSAQAGKGYDLFIGRHHLNKDYFNGYIQLVRVYSHGLSDREVKHNYNNLFEPVRRGLVLYLSPFSIDIVNSVWYDESGFENHGTIYGATLRELWRPEQ